MNSNPTIGELSKGLFRNAFKINLNQRKVNSSELSKYMYESFTECYDEIKTSTFQSYSSFHRMNLATITLKSLDKPINLYYYCAIFYCANNHQKYKKHNISI